jgi:magnesium-transporting ATPase (P-type)
MVKAKLNAVQETQLKNLKAIAQEHWHAIPIEEVTSRLGVTTSGLTTAQVEASRERYGPNSSPPAPRPGLLSKIWDQVNNVLIYVLIAATIIKGVFQDWADMGLILGVIILNVAIGVIQEGKAEAAAEALNSMLAQRAIVVRDGKQQSIEAEELVIGDVVLLTAGDSVPADLRFFEASNLKVKEAALTGESLDVDKVLTLVRADAGIGDQKNRGFAGTQVTGGSGTGIVVAIGATAMIGTIRTMIEEADNTETPLQHQLDVFGTYLSITTIILAIISFIIALLDPRRGVDARNAESVRNGLSESFAIAVGIAVAIIPEGLPSVVTITLALGVRRMAEHNAIIRQLPAVETLGSVSVICSDKTGTLTLNQMMVTKLRTATHAFEVAGQGYDPYSGEVKLGESAIRKDNPDLMRQLYWLALPGVLANDGGLNPPNPTAAQWPSKRSLSGAKPIEVGSAVATDPEAINAGTDKEGKQWTIAGDPTDVAVLVLGHKVGVEGNINAFKSRYVQVGKIPFDSDYKFMAVMQDVDTPAGRKRLVYIKGAWDEVIRRCSTQAAANDAFAPEPVNQAFWLKEASTYAANGMRVLAVAQWEVPADKATLTVEEIRDTALATPCLQLNCLVSIVDPCRDSAGRAVQMCHTAQIRVKMITGDHADTACYIAQQLHILTPAKFEQYMAVKDTDPEARKRIVLKGEDIKNIPASENETELAKYVLDVDVFARVSPEHKLRIVRALKNTCGKITSMTGDGVNDAPALKEAHVGVAMGITGTDVAKQAAKMILADDLFATIAEAVRRGRGVYDNLKKVVLFALPTNMAQGICIVVALLLGITTPLNSIQVLTVNLVTSVTLGIVIALEEPEPNVMERPPRNPDAALLDYMMVWKVTWATICLVCTMIGNMQWHVNFGYSVPAGRAAAMTTLVVGQAFFALNCRFVASSSITYRVFVGNYWIPAAILVNLLVQVFLVYVPGVNTVWAMDPIDGPGWGKVILLAFSVFLAVEAEKFVGPYLYPYSAPLVWLLDLIIAAIVWVAGYFSWLAGGAWWLLTCCCRRNAALAEEGEAAASPTPIRPAGSAAGTGITPAPADGPVDKSRASDVGVTVVAK